MKTEQKIRDLSMVLINILVWFEILWAAVFVTGMVFHWGDMTNRFAMAFFACGVCAGMVLLALNILNFAANFNIISKAQAARATNEPIEELKSASLVRTVSIAMALISLVVLVVGVAEWRLYKTKEREAVAKIEAIADSKLAAEAVSLISKDSSIKNLSEVREAMSASIQEGSRLSIIFPKKIKGVELYYEFTAWYGEKDSDKKISEVDLSRFIPTDRERDKFGQLMKGDRQGFTVRKDRDLRTYRRVKTDQGMIVLLLDTSRRSLSSMD